MTGRGWARLILDGAAGSWAVALVLTLSWAMTQVPMPIWLPALAFALTSVGRRRSHAMAIAVLILCTAAAPFATYWPNSAIYLLGALGAAAVAQSLPRTAPHWAVRTHFQLGIGVLVASGIIRLIAGSPPGYMLLVPALVLTAAGFFGLPYVHSLDSLGSDAHAREIALPGMRLGGLMLACVAVFALLVALLGLMQHLGLYAPVVYRVFQFLSPVIAMLFSFIAWAFSFYRPPPPHKANPKNTTAPKHHLPKPNHLSPAGAFTLHFVEAAIVIALIAAFIYYLYARQRRLSEEAEEANAPGERAQVAFGRILGRRRIPLDFGSGPRALVRKAVARHVLAHDMPPGDTARRIAEREGWPADALQTYEEARYRLARSFEEERATGFVQRFQAWRRARRSR